jgi:hypothetical protein
LRQSPAKALATALAAAVICLVPAWPALAQGSSQGATQPKQDPNALRSVTDLKSPPGGYRRSARDIQAIADRVEKVVAERKKFPGSYASVFTKGPGRWQVSYYSRTKPPKEIAQVAVDDATGGVIEAWTGHQVAWTMARGYPGAFGRKVNSPLIWIPLSILFLAPFVTPRRPLRMLHLDLLVLLAFGVSIAYFNDARIGVSVPLAYPLLGYLLARMLWIGLRRGDEKPRRPLPLLVPVSWLGIAVVFLIGFRIGLNVTNSNVIDVGYSGVIGAHKLVHGDTIYGGFPKDDPHGDTYGPVGYAAYVPFESVLPWKGIWDNLPAAHAAALVFDLLCIVLLFLIGRQIRGPGLGTVLAYAWATFPLTLYVANTNSNDALVAVFALGAVAAASSPRGRGMLAALGGLTKFGSLGLVPLLAAHGPPGQPLRRRVLPFGIAFALVSAVAMAPIVLGGESLSTMYDRTIGFQAERGSPFSIWGLYELTTLQTAWQVSAAALAVAVAFIPRRRDVVGLAALAAAVLIALQMGVTHWFYLYVVWFFGLAAVAIFGRYGEPSR